MEEHEDERDVLISSEEKSEPISFFKALMLPGVIMVFKNFFLKLSNFSF